MKSQQLIERIKKNEEKLVKKEALLQKKLSKMDLDINLELKTTELYKIYYNSVDYGKWCEIESLKSTYNDIKDIKDLIEKYKKQLETAKQKEEKLVEIPQVLVDFKQYLIDTWTKQDLDIRKFYKKEYKALGYKEFVDKYKYTSYIHMNMEKKEFVKINTKDAETLILNFIKRVEDKAGEIKDCSNLIVTEGNGGYSVINGFVEGTKGKAVVESIGAGGYNIQKYHIRVLVK